MTPITMKYLEDCFKQAKKFNQKFVAVKIEMDNLPLPEIIINPTYNAEDKLQYYKQAYDEDLAHKYAGNDIKITGFAFGNDMNEIENQLLY